MSEQGRGAAWTEERRGNRKARLRRPEPRGKPERRYRRLLTLYPKDHRREHAEEMVGVLLATAGDARSGRRAKAWALRFGQETADRADLVVGAHGSAAG